MRGTSDSRRWVETISVRGANRKLFGPSTVTRKAAREYASIPAATAS